MDKNRTLHEEYYLLIEPEERKLYLEEEEKDGANASVHALREELFAIRYHAQSKKGTCEYIDNFMKLWLELAIEAADGYSGRRRKKAYANISAFIESIGLPAFREKGVEAREALYCEFRHLTRTYIYSCENSKSYTRMFDLLPISKSRVSEKINNDVKTAMIECPKEIGLLPQLPELTEAAIDELDFYNSRQTLQN